MGLIVACIGNLWYIPARTESRAPSGGDMIKTYTGELPSELDTERDCKNASSDTPVDSSKK